MLYNMFGSVGVNLPPFNKNISEVESHEELEKGPGLMEMRSELLILQARKRPKALHFSVN